MSEKLRKRRGQGSEESFEEDVRDDWRNRARPKKTAEYEES
jgi:hypothetical protein